MFPTIGDNGLEQEQDWWLSGESIILMDKLEAMPKLDTVIKVLNQYIHDRHKTSCTKFAPYNVFATIRNHEQTWEEMDEIEAKSLELGREWPGNGWSASEGFDALRKTLNPKYPEKAMSKWKYEIWSDVRKKLLDKCIPVGCSILVDSVYRKDVKDGKVDGIKFEKNYWHADVIQKNPNGEWYMMIDSVGGITYTISQEVLDGMATNGNIRGYWYCLLPIDIMQMPELSTQLPEHIKPWQVQDPDDKDIIVAWETEVSERLNSGGDVNRLYRSYKGNKATTRMLIDLKFIRGF